MSALQWVILRSWAASRLLECIIRLGVGGLGWETSCELAQALYINLRWAFLAHKAITACHIPTQTSYGTLYYWHLLSSMEFLSLLLYMSLLFSKGPTHCFLDLPIQYFFTIFVLLVYFKSKNHQPWSSLCNILYSYIIHNLACHLSVMWLGAMHVRVWMSWQISSYP